ncbi:MAG: hypothetical protein U5R46_02205 [Gammaproteobacteria bacterium]|nr:hypothetical protein [Gammaproteobacteria bacterium]
MRKRIDRFVEDALVEFGEWYVRSDWNGKERDCVNLFANRFLGRRVQKGAAIQDPAEMRVEGPVPQPTGYRKPTAAKDLVVWSDALATTWDTEWQAVDWPRLVMEWKFRRRGRPSKDFDTHDLEWLCAYTDEYDKTFGYLVRVYHGEESRSVDWAKVVRGELNDTNRRS